MITYRTRGLYILHFVAQLAGTALLFWGWLFLTFSVLREHEPFAVERYAVYTCILLGGLAIDFLRAGGTTQNFLDMSRRRNRVLSLRQAVTALLALLLFVFAARDQTMSRLFIFSFMPVLYVLLFFTNKLVPPWLATMIFNGKRRQRTVLVGSPQSVSRLADWLKGKAHYGLEPVGLVSNEAAGQTVAGIPCLGTERELDRILEETRASQVVVAELPQSSHRISELGHLCDRRGIHLLIMNNLEEHIGRAVSFVQDGGMRFLSLRDEPLECPFNRMLKRTVDILVSLPVVVFVLPFTSLAVYICHRLQSPGPTLFRQLRTGINGEDFLIYKYRTMHLGPFDESKQATQGDPRIFRAGSVLRKLSIDELPQFINVLKGDMSIVGPRPHLKTHDEIFSSVAHSYRVRALIRPGITGLAQVSGYRGEARQDEDIVSRVRSDLFYLENWSVVMDTVIVFKTAFQMIFPPRAAL